MRSRVDAQEYERLLVNSVLFLSLKHGGAANTLVIECIARNSLLIAPRLQSVIEYIGADYPLLYEKSTLDLVDLVSEQRMEAARAYLRAMDKSFLRSEHFVQSIESSAVLAYLPHNVDVREHFEVT